MSQEQFLQLPDRPEMHVALDYLLGPTSFRSFDSIAQVVSCANTHAGLIRQKFRSLYTSLKIGKSLVDYLLRVDGEVKYRRSCQQCLTGLDSSLLFPSYGHAVADEVDVLPDLRFYENFASYSEFKLGGSFNAELTSRGVYSLYRSAVALSHGFSVFVSLEEESQETTHLSLVFPTLGGFNKQL